MMRDPIGRSGHGEPRPRLSPCRVLPAALLACLMLLPASDPGAQEAVPATAAGPAAGLPPVLRAEPGVKDAVFSLLVGLISSGTYGTLDQARLEQELKRQGRHSHLPYQSVEEVTRVPVLPGRTARVTVKFRGPLAMAIPYSILTYHPGSFTASETCRFREWILGRVRLPFVDHDGRPVQNRTLDLDDVHLFGLESGAVKIDIDGWLDALMGDNLDDTDITALLLCRYQGDWLGFAMGYNKDGKGRSGAFGFAKDEILFPTPSELRPVGREMRTRSEQLGRSWVEGVKVAGPVPAGG